jgi:hypothetical protein
MMVCIQKGTGLHEISNRRWGLGVLLAGLQYWVWAVAVQSFYANRLDDMNHDRGLESGAVLALGLSASR